MVDEITDRKNFKGILIIDYRTGAFKVAKRKSNRLKPTEIPINISLDFIIPRQPEFEAKGEITLTHAQMAGMMLDRLESSP